jgi:LiaI-LiaF-like transmembrane region
VTSSSLLQAIRGPVLLLTLGLLMAADQLDRVSFSRTWPVLLILFGLFKLAEHMGVKDV